jgi:hypothetical protein
MFASGCFFFATTFPGWLPWNTIAIDISLPSNSWSSTLVVLNGTSTVLTTTTTRQNNTVWIPIDLLHNTEIQVIANSYNESQDANAVHVPVIFYPVYTQPAFGTPIVIRYLKELQ